MNNDMSSPSNSSNTPLIGTKRTPRSPRKTTTTVNPPTEKVGSNGWQDLINDLELGDFSTHQQSSLLRPFAWNGATVTI